MSLKAPILTEGLRPSDSPTRSLPRRCAGALRSRGSLARSLAILTQRLRPSDSPTRSLPPSQGSGGQARSVSGAAARSAEAARVVCSRTCSLGGALLQIAPRAKGRTISDAVTVTGFLRRLVVCIGMRLWPRLVGVVSRGRSARRVVACCCRSVVHDCTHRFHPLTSPTIRTKKKGHHRLGVMAR